MPHARDNLDPVCFDLHAAAAPVALLAPPKFAIDGVERDGNPGGQTRQCGDQALAVRFAGCFKTEHSRENFMVADSLSGLCG